MFEEPVTQALKALRNADAGVETGPETEIRTLLAYRRQQRRHKSQKLAMWGGGIAAAVVLVALCWPAREAPQKLVAGGAPAGVPIKTEAVPVLAPAMPPPPVKPIAPRQAEPQEIATGFFPLMDNPPPFERGLLVRMTVPASAMRTVGLPVGDDHLSDLVQADVLVGQDDLARAIRFVSYRK